ncbi:MAG: glycerate kinase [Actinomycetales bacterium]
MRIIIAPDKFKGSLSAPEVAEALATGLQRSPAGADLELVLVPVADGGEGTLDAAVGAGFSRRSATVSGPTGEPVRATFTVRGREAVIEMAAASGLALLPGGVPAPLTAGSRGTGELIRAALDAGCTDIILGVGGSANTDGGAGMLTGLGARMLDADGADLGPGGAALARLAVVDLDGLDPRLADARIVLATDVDNPLRGVRGAPAVFGPQKGATAAEVEALDAALGVLVDKLAAAAGPAARRHADTPGAGAAGGVGYAALAVLAAAHRPGIDVVLGFTQLAGRVAGADLVITGEGSLDEQSLGGKTPVGVARTAAAAGVPVVAVCGRTTLAAAQLHAAGFAQTFALTALEPDVDACIRDAARLLERIGERIGAQLAHHPGFHTAIKENIDV